MSSSTPAVSSEFPRRTATYIGPRTDSRRWHLFERRPGDIFICTPPKCGTTWTQAICALLVFESPEFDGQISRISPWLDGNTATIEACLDTLGEQTHRRFIKTHTPLDGIPYFDDCSYLMVYRDPRDAYFSLRSHNANLHRAQDSAILSDDPRDGFRAWLDGAIEAGAGDQRSLAAFIHHYQSYHRFAHLPNFHFFHFADFKRCLLSSFNTIANALNIAVAPERMSELCQAASFSSMKSDPKTYAPGFDIGVWKDASAFFSKGENAQWQGVLQTEELDHYAARISSLLPAREIYWLENGRSS